MSFELFFIEIYYLSLSISQSYSTPADMMRPKDFLGLKILRSEKEWTSDIWFTGFYLVQFGPWEKGY